MITKSIMAKAMKAAKAVAYGTGEYVGWCLACCRKATGVEPDARKYPCEHCHAKKVYGAEEIVMMGAF